MVLRRAPRPAGLSGRVLEVDNDVFGRDDPVEIAATLKRSAEASRWRKGTPFRSAMSMLTFYINRAGSSLSVDRRRVLEAAKIELRRAFGKEPAAGG